MSYARILPFYLKEWTGTELRYTKEKDRLIFTGFIKQDTIPRKTPQTKKVIKHQAALICLYGYLT